MTASDARGVREKDEKDPEWRFRGLYVYLRMLVLLVNAWLRVCFTMFHNEMI